MYEKVNYTGNAIRKYRKDLKLTQRQLADKAGVSEASIKKYEKGERFPKMEQLEKIALALNVLPEFLSDGYTYNYLKSSSSILAETPLLEYLQSEGSVIKYLTEEDKYRIVIDNLKQFADDTIYSKIYTLTAEQLEKINKEAIDIIRKLIALMGEEWYPSEEDFEELRKSIKGK